MKSFNSKHQILIKPGERVEVRHEPLQEATTRSVTGQRLGYTSEAFPQGPYYCAICDQGHRTPQGLRGHNGSNQHKRALAAQETASRVPRGFSRSTSQSSIASSEASSEAENDTY